MHKKFAYEINNVVESSYQTDYNPIYDYNWGGIIENESIDSDEYSDDSSLDENEDIIEAKNNSQKSK